jgi:hypothetical protein
VRTRDGAETRGLAQAGEQDKRFDIASVGAPGLFVSDIGEPFDFRGDIGKIGKLFGRELGANGRKHGRGRGVVFLGISGHYG